MPAVYYNSPSGDHEWKLNSRNFTLPVINPNILVSRSVIFESINMLASFLTHEMKTLHRNLHHLLLR